MEKEILEKEFPNADHKHVPRLAGDDDEIRCHATERTTGERCRFASIPGQQYCPMHGKDLRNDTAMYNFKRTTVLNRMKALQNHTSARTLAEELGLLRLLLEEAVNRCTDDLELLTSSPQIQALVDKIRVVQDSNVKLEQKLGDLMSLEEVVTIAQSLYSVVCTHITDVEILDAIGRELENVLCTAAAPPTVNTGRK